MTADYHRANDRLDSIQALRGAAALAVVLFHFFIVETIYGPDHLAPGFFGYGRAGVDLFFVISGFIIVHVTRNLPAGEKTARSFLFRRLQRVYPPYWIITLGMLALWLVTGGSAFNGLIGENRNFLQSLALWPEGRDPVLNVGWTLVHEIYFYLAFTLILFTPPKWRPPLLAIWGGAMAAFYFSSFHTLSPETRLASHPLNLEFLMGAFVAWLRPHAGPNADRVAWVLAAIFLVAVIAVFGAAPTDPDFDQYWTRALLFGPLAACIVFLCAQKTSAPAWLKGLGDRSYALYLLHIPLFAIFGTVWRKFAAQGPWDNLAAFLLVIAAVIATADMFYRFVEQPLLRFKPQRLRAEPA